VQKCFVHQEFLFGEAGPGVESQDGRTADSKMNNLELGDLNRVQDLFCQALCGEMLVWKLLR
jgi:hypothetical protein